MSSESRSLVLPKRVDESSPEEIKVKTYWHAVGGKLLRDKITMAAIVLLILMVSSALAAPWLAQHVVGFDPLAADLFNRDMPPTWATKSWPEFQQFTATC